MLNVTMAPGGTTLSGAVRGSERTPYRVMVQISPGSSRSRPQIVGTCTCPMHTNCKHVAALLLHALEHDTSPAPFEISQVAAAQAPADPALRDWLKRVAGALAPAPAPATPAEIAERLLYILSLDTRYSPPNLTVNNVVVRRLKNGTYGKEQRFNGQLGARFISQADRAALISLGAINPMTTQNPILAGSDGARLLREIIATGRCHWESGDTPPLTLGEARAAHFEWTMSSDGAQHLLCVGENVDIVLAFEIPWYVDITTHSCGPLHTGLPDAVAAALVTAPALRPEHAQLARDALKALEAQAAVPLPRSVERIESIIVKPKPCLHLFTATLAVGRYQRWQFNADSVDLELARLSFDYEGIAVTVGDTRAVLTRMDNGRVVHIPRDLKTEHEALEKISAWYFEPVEAGDGYEVPDEHRFDLTIHGQERVERLTNFALHGVDELRAAGWRIDIDPGFTYRRAENVGDWYADITEDSGNDWFDVELGITVDGKRISLLPVLVNMVRNMPREFSAQRLDQVKNRSIAVNLGDGRVLSVPVERLRSILSTLVELYDTDQHDTQRARLPKIRAAQLSELENSLGTRIVWSGGERLRELGRKLRDFDGIAAVPPPEGLRTELRGYQQQGLNWLQFLRAYELGGILADDMGLGKTVQALAHLLVEKNSGRMDRPSLVIAPTSLMVNWRMEAERFAPSLRVLVSHGLERKQQFDKLADYDLILTTYPLLPRDFAELSQQDYHLLILDEAQVVKNPKAKASQLVRQLRARQRLCLTGTPMENHLGELWSLFDFLMPGLLGDERQFRNLFRNPIEKYSDKDRSQSLTRRIAPFLLRRTKGEVAKELPPKTEILRSVELAGSQRDLYESIRLAMHEKVQREINQKGMARSHIVILDALLKLRQACCDPRLLKLDAAKNVTQSAKLESLMDMLPELIEEGRRVLLFSQFTSMLALIEAELRKADLEYVLLTGDTTDRTTPIQRFQNGAVPLFLISLKAGGTGLNLTAADTVIHYDPWWNPAVENQATDRAHRIGQDKPVFVYKLITLGTVEEKIMAMQTRKKELADSLFDPDAKSGPQLTAADLSALFEPLE
ncbi:MAG: DEAD/DEAH box helicase [Gammaproteobacteria bacterium]|nr:DEAD/DEAH box helicase [Gammaproteobacteria bacterium]